MDLIQVIESELGGPDTNNGQPFWCCPFHDDCNASLTTYKKNGKERFKCFGCTKSGDGIDFLRLLHSEMTFAEAKQKVSLFSLTGQRKPIGLLAYRPPKTAGHKPAPSWWKVVVSGSVARMWEPQFGALDWLRNRGLSDQTIREAKLGINEEGITIPWFSSYGALLAVNIRRFNGEPKYRFLKDSVKGFFYPAVQLDYRKPVLLCEGEFDTLLVRQEAGDLVQAVTLGSAGDKPTARTLTHLALSRFLFVAFDGDEAGDKGYRRLKGVLRHARRVRPPEGTDMTDIHRTIGLRKWLLGHQVVNGS